MHAFFALVALQSAPITLEANARPVSEIVARVAEQGGLDLAVDPGFEQNVVVVRFSQASPQQAMEDIAWAVRGKWVPVNGQQVLQPDPEAWRAGQQKLLKQDKDLIYAARGAKPPQALTGPRVRALLSDLDYIDRSRDPNVSDRRYEIDLELAIDNTLGKILLWGLSDSDYGMLAEGRRIIYALKPTGLQRPLTPRMIQMIESFQGGQAVLREQMPEKGDSVAVGGLRGGHLLIEFSYGNGAVSVRMNSAVGEDLLSYDSLFAAELDKLPRYLPPAVPNISVTITPEWSLLADVWSGKTQTRDASQMSSLRADIDSWTERDPLAVTTGDALLAWSRAAGKSMVVDVPEAGVGLMGGSQPGTRPLSEFASKLMDQGRMEWEDRTTLRMRPTDPELSLCHAPRAGLMEWVYKVEESDFVSEFHDWMILIGLNDSDEETDYTVRAAAGLYQYLWYPYPNDSAGLRIASHIYAANSQGKGRWEAPLARLDSAEKTNVRRLFLDQAIAAYPRRELLPMQREGWSWRTFTFADIENDPISVFGANLPANAQMVVATRPTIESSVIPRKGQGNDDDPLIYSSVADTSTLEGIALLMAVSEYERMLGKPETATTEISRILISLVDILQVEVGMETPGTVSSIRCVLPHRLAPPQYADPALYGGPHADELRKRAKERLQDITRGSGNLP